VDWAGGPCGIDPVTNDPPVANFDFTPAAPQAGDQVDFLSTSTDPDGAIDPSATKWDLNSDGDFNDPEDGTGLTATRTFSSPGAFPVSIQVTDDDGAMATETKLITVAPASNLPPLAGFTFFPPAPSPGQDVTFTSSSIDTDGAIQELAWDFDADGQFDDAFGGQVTRAFTTAGSYPVALRATDDDGAFSIETHVVTIGPQPTSPTPPSDEPTCRGRAPTIMGTGGDDRLRGTDGNDSIAALGGDDRVLGLGGNDAVCGGGGNDRLNGGVGGDALLGNKGDDRLRGGGGGDLLLGGPGRDKEAGGAGRDRCGGRLGNCP
jgi:PKD repeat protein